MAALWRCFIPLSAAALLGAGVTVTCHCHPAGESVIFLDICEKSRVISVKAPVGETACVQVGVLLLI